MLDVAGQLDRQGAARLAHAIVAVELRAAVKDDRHGGQGDHVVDDRRLAEQAGDGRQRRLEAHHAALAFQAFQQRGFLAADVGAGPLAHFEFERLAAAQHVITQIPTGLRQRDGARQDVDGVRIFGAHVDVAAGRADCDPGNRHTFDQHIGIAFHDHAIGESTGIALVGIADDVLLVGSRVEHGLPLDPRREGRAAAAAQSRIGQLLDDVRAIRRQRIAQASPATVCRVVLEAERIGDADAGESQAFLPFKVGNVFGVAVGKLVRSALEEVRLEQGRHVRNSHRAVGNAAFGRADFHHRFQPVQAA